mmetsp:Transcript_12692/g.12720  ORF Transcript_12692/g.12720 Transcript_12692/m.12720 type:complete len:113 (+) Transcript_12692:17-355(+)
MKTIQILTLILCVASLATTHAYVRDVLHFKDLLDLEGSATYKVAQATSKYTCKESDEVHAAMLESQAQARLEQPSNREVVEEVGESLVGIGVRNQQLACLVFQLAIDEDINQ